MPLYEVGNDGLQRRDAAQYAALGIYERADLQRMLRQDISPLGADLLVVAEEFGNWEDARRRIDLLAIDKAGHVVVIELKRTDDGGHMDLQSIRYAAMVSSLNFMEVAAAYAAHCAKYQPNEAIDTRAELATFLGFDDDAEEPVISSDVRIILVSADFGREITTTVLWLNGFDGMDIRCIRLVPYEIEGKVLLDIQQVIPLPEAADYQVRLRRKDAARERARGDGRDFTRYHIVVNGIELPDENKRNSVRLMVQKLAESGAPLSAVHDALPQRPRMRALPGKLTTGDEVRNALAADPKVDVPRWFTDDAMVDDAANETYVLIKMWGRNTEPTLIALRDAFPNSGVTFRRAQIAPEL